MKADAFLAATAAGAIAVAAAQETAAQNQPTKSLAPPAAVQLTVPPSGMAFNFSDIDRNGDRNISVDEWNAFVASLQSRAATKDSSSATGGATTAPRQAQPQQR